MQASATYSLPHWDLLVQHHLLFTKGPLLLHLPAVAHAAGLRVPSVDDWMAVNKAVPRLVSVLPNGPVHHPTIRVFLAGGVPEVMLHLRRLGLIDASVLTVTGRTWGEALDEWESSQRRARLRQRLIDADGVDPDDVIMDPERARARGITSTITFLTGNIAPEGAIVKSTAINPERIGVDGVCRQTGVVKVFTTERAAIAAIKSGAIAAGDIMVLMGRGPSGSGMEETYQLTSALRHLSFGQTVALLTDARFSGVSTGLCIGHIGPEALAGGPLGKVRTGDVIEIVIDCRRLEGSVHFVGTPQQPCTPEQGVEVLRARQAADLRADPDLPDDTRMWAALQAVSGGTWKGSVYDVDRIVTALEAGRQVLGW